MLKATNVFTSNSIKDTDLTANSILNALIETGQCVAFYAEINNNTNNSYSMYFAQKVEQESTSDEALSFGIIANTTNRGNRTRIFRSVSSAKMTFNGKEQDVTVNVKDQIISFTYDGKTSNHKTANMVIVQMRSIGLPPLTTETARIGYRPVFVADSGYCAVDGVPVFDKFDLRSHAIKTYNSAVATTIKHNGFIDENEMFDYLTSMDVNEQDIERLMGQSQLVSDKVDLNAKF
jgi:co-chaperonin GroES (HSP10)